MTPEQALLHKKANDSPQFGDMERDDMPVVAKAVMAFYIILHVGIFGFVVAVFGASWIERLAIACLGCSFLGLSYFIGPLNRGSFYVQTADGRRKLRELTSWELLLAALAGLLLLIGLILWELR